MKRETSYIQAGDTFINLQTVSNINILKNKNRIVYNFSYPINIEVNGTIKVVSEYLYDDVQDIEAKQKELFNNHYIKENYIHQGLNLGLINKNKISSFKLQPERLRVIFNMSHSVEITTKDKSIFAPEFVYVHLGSKEEYNEYINLLNRVIL